MDEVAARTRALHETIDTVASLEARYRALIAMLRMERSVLASTDPGDFEDATARRAAVLAEIDSEETALRASAERLAAAFPDPSSLPAARSAATPGPLRALAARVASITGDARLALGLDRLRAVVQRARSLAATQRRFAERGLADLRNALERLAAEPSAHGGYARKGRIGAARAHAGAVVRETA